MNFRKTLAVLGLAASFGWSAGAAAALCTTITPTAACTGSFTSENEVQLFDLVVDGTINPILTSTGFGNEGFLPMLSFFDGSGNFIGSFDGSTGTGDFFVDTVAALIGYSTGGFLNIGTYTVALTVFQNSSADELLLSSGFIFDTVPTSTFAQGMCPAGADIFCYNDPVTGDPSVDSARREWELTVTGLSNNPDTGLPAGTITPQAVPEPLSVALFGIGLAGLGFARRRKAA